MIKPTPPLALTFVLTLRKGVHLLHVLQCTLSLFCLSLPLIHTHTHTDTKRERDKKRRIRRIRKEKAEKKERKGTGGLCK